MSSNQIDTNKFSKKILSLLKKELNNLYDDFIKEMQYSDTIISGTIIPQVYYNER